MDDLETRLGRVAAEVGELDEAEAAAEVLVAAAVDTRDRDVWGGDRALTFWDRLPEKVRSGCYAGPTVAAWWERMCRVLGSGQPHRAPDRVVLARAIATDDQRAVLDALRTHAEALCLRVRLAAQLDREAADDGTTTETGTTVGDGQEAML